MLCLSYLTVLLRWWMTAAALGNEESPFPSWIRVLHSHGHEVKTGDDVRRHSLTLLLSGVTVKGLPNGGSRILEP